MEFCKETIYVKNRTKQQIELMEKEFQYCQEHLDDEECKKHLFELFWEALRIVVTKKTKDADIYNWSWNDRITDGTIEYMHRYEKNPNYRSPYLFKAAHWMSLKILYSNSFKKKYEQKNEISLDGLLNTISYSNFEDEILDKLEKEGY